MTNKKMVNKKVVATQALPIFFICFFSRATGQVTRILPHVCVGSRVSIRRALVRPLQAR